MTKRQIKRLKLINYLFVFQVHPCEILKYSLTSATSLFKVDNNNNDDDDISFFNIQTI